MPDDLPLRGPRITVAQFQAFYATRPKEEKWELIDGVAMMMSPPTLIHQRIARDLETLINIRLRAVRPEWQADREVGVLLTGDDRYNPEPDVTVTDAELRIGQIYAERFYFVAEVLSLRDSAGHESGSDRPEALAAKLACYNRHEHCRAVMVVHQDRIAASLYTRAPPGEWRKAEIEDAETVIDLPDIGPIGRLGEIYRNTPLNPFKSP